MSLRSELIRKKLNEFGIFDSSIIESLTIVEGKRFHVEQVDKVLEADHVFSVSINLSVINCDYSGNDLMDMRALFPENYREGTAPIGFIDVYKPVKLDVDASDYNSSKIERTWSWSGELFIAFDGSVWVYSEDRIFNAAQGIPQFIIIDPKTHYGMRYY